MQTSSVSTSFFSQIELFEKERSKKSLIKLFSMIPRWVPKNTSLTPFYFKQEATIHLSQWLQADTTLDQIARLYLLMLANELMDRQELLAAMNDLFKSADINELVLLYRSLSFMDKPEDFMLWARQGIRSNMSNAFEAIALNNIYPSSYFDNEGWNQLILKAVYIGCPLGDIVGIDERNNPALSQMLCDFIRERNAARRNVPWDIWRCIGVGISRENIGLLKTEMRRDDLKYRFAAALAFKCSEYYDYEFLLDLYPEVARQIHALTWVKISTLNESQ